MTSQSVPATPAFVQDLRDTAFQQAVVHAAALMDRPEFTGRLQKAMDFVLSGSVILQDDGTATVKSGAHTYGLPQNVRVRTARPAASTASITWQCNYSSGPTNGSASAATALASRRARRAQEPRRNPAASALGMCTSAVQLHPQMVRRGY